MTTIEEILPFLPHGVVVKTDKGDAKILQVDFRPTNQDFLVQLLDPDIKEENPVFWTDVEDITPYLHPIENMVKAKDGKTPLAELTEFIQGLGCGEEKILEGDIAVNGAWDIIMVKAPTRKSRLPHDVKEIKLPVAETIKAHDFLRRMHFAVGLQEPQFIKICKE